MSEFQLQRRERISAWLARRDTVISEAWTGLAALVIAWRVVDVYQGKSAAPFTSSTLLQLDGGKWIFALVFTGLATLAALVVGLATGNTFRVRGWFGAISAFVWTVVAVATLTAPGPRSVALGYCLPMLASWFSALVLMVRADLSKNLCHPRESARRSEKSEEQERRCVARQRIL